MVSDIGAAMERVEGWTAELPRHVRFRTQSDMRHSRGRAFYNEDTGEVLHRARNYRKTHPDKVYAMVADSEDPAYREETTLRKYLSDVADVRGDRATIWSGSTGERLETIQVGGRDTRHRQAGSVEEALAIADQALLEYAETGEYTGAYTRDMGRTEDPSLPPEEERVC